MLSKRRYSGGYLEKAPKRKKSCPHGNPSFLQPGLGKTVTSAQSPDSPLGSHLDEKKLLHKIMRAVGTTPSESITPYRT